MKFGSVCSGIEAASAAWKPLGWEAAWFSEIEPFPSAVLKHHYPKVPNLGDMTTLSERILLGEVEAPELFCGGTPCQAFSVAGLRKSLDDARGNLSLTFCEIANAIDFTRRLAGLAPSVIFWENVPGVLSTKDNALGCFLAGLAGDDQPIEPGPRPEPGRSSAHWTWKKDAGQHCAKWPDAGVVTGPRRTVAWRVLDAQYFGLAQRRRRVFVVASARNGFDPAAVLFEWGSVRRDSAPSREAGKDTAACAAAGTGVRRWPADVASTLNAAFGEKQGLEDQHALSGAPLFVPAVAFSSKDYGADAANDIAPTLRAMGHAGSHANGGGQVAVAVTGEVFHTLRGEGFDASEDGTGRGTPLVPVAFAQNSRDEVRLMGGDGGIVGALAAEPGMKQTCYVAFHPTQDPISSTDGSTHALGCGSAGGQASVAVALHGREGGATTQVRRLTPRECERLMGFPDDYTLVPLPLKGRQTRVRWASDSARYKALGNSWAVPVVRWIGARIAAAVTAKASEPPAQHGLFGEAA